jgi:Arm DNA-binding domain
MQTQFVNTKKQWKMEHRVSVLFYARKSKKTSKGLSPIYMRLTINGHRLEHSIQRYVEPSQWSARAGRVKGSNDQARQINFYLDTLNGKVQKLEREMTLDGIVVNPSNFREKWLGLTQAPRMLMEIFQQHNDQMASLIKVREGFCPWQPGTIQYLPGPHPQFYSVEVWNGGYRYQAAEFRICQRIGVLVENRAELCPQHDHEIY